MVHIYWSFLHIDFSLFLKGTAYFFIKVDIWIQIKITSTFLIINKDFQNAL